MRIIGILLVACLMGVGCGGQGADCRVGADCASGVCLSDGTCGPVEDDGGNADGDLDGDVDGDVDGGMDGGGDDGDAADADDGGDAGDQDNWCLPNRDGLVTRDEVAIRAGLRATFAVSGQTLVDTAGETQADGSRVWDLSGALSGDHLDLVELRDLAGKWFAPTYPDATYYSTLRSGEDLLGVFEGAADALLLSGVVSPEDGMMRTELTFDPEVSTLQFPLQMGSAWTTAATVSGVAMGAVVYYFEDYESQVDAWGSLKTPYGTFDVLRVRVEMTRTVGMLVTRLRSFLFVAECFGTVAVIHSLDGESEVEFSEAAEVRRLAP